MAAARGRTSGSRPAAPFRASSCTPPIPTPRTSASIGDLWQPSAERGLYKTTDAGASWKAILTAPAPLGNRSAAATWRSIRRTRTRSMRRSMPACGVPSRSSPARRRRMARTPGGIFKSTDGGATWKKLTDGLPTRTQRIGLAVSAKDPEVVMAVVQSDEAGNTGDRGHREKSGGTYRSDERWRALDPDEPARPAPVLLQPDPHRPDQRSACVRARLHAARLRRWR